MVSGTSAAQWLVDHVGADWLHVTLRSNDVVGTNFLVTLRFDNDYCQSLVKLHFNYSSHAELHQTLVRRISQVRDEFFLLKMHALPVEEGVKLESLSRI
jgi:hypothetical protein